MESPERKRMPAKKKVNAETCSQAPWSPEWFETILCSLNDGVFCVDKDFRITCFNKAAAGITGFPREKAIGMHCHEVFRTNICEGACALRYTMETGNPLVNQPAICS